MPPNTTEGHSVWQRIDALERGGMLPTVGELKQGMKDELGEEDGRKEDGSENEEEREKEMPQVEEGSEEEEALILSDECKNITLVHNIHYREALSYCLSQCEKEEGE